MLSNTNTKLQIFKYYVAAFRLFVWSVTCCGSMAWCLSPVFSWLLA